jgi:glycolate oxidase
MLQLFDFMDRDRVLATPEELLSYSYDATRHRSLPSLVLMPSSKEEVIRIVKTASRERIPIVPRGAGTSLSGGSVPITGGIVVDFTLMNSIKEVDLENFLVTVEPGVVYDKLNRRLAEHGVFFPPDPGSASVCTIGGMVATNSSGLRAVKYGTTKDYVKMLEVVLADGEVIRCGTKAVKSSSGYYLPSIFVGSEGTLGLFTEITLRVVRKPTYYATAAAGFKSMADAGKAVRDIIFSGLRPAALEVMDRHTLQAVERYIDVKFPDVSALLIVELDGFNPEVNVQLRKAVEVFKSCGAVEVEEAVTESDREAIWKARKSSLPALARYKPTLILEDVTVPISALPSMFEKIEEIAYRHRLEIATFGHAGDGNLHPTLLVDRDNAEEMARAERAVEELFYSTIEMGGTLSGEHGIGVEKKRYMSLEHKNALDIMREIKKFLDPNGILNPGKIFWEGER